MPDIQIKITNIAEIRAAFRKSPELMVRELNKAITKTLLKVKGSEILEYRALGIRVITGGLITSIQRGIYQSNLRGEVGPNVTGSPGVDYAVYVHSGTRYMAARPFLLNAVKDDTQNIEGYFKTAVENVLSAIGKAT